jgi:hypothetical protein
MTTIAQAQRGIANFIDREVIPSLSVMERIVVGTGAGLITAKLPEVIKIYANHPLMQAMNVVDLQKGEIDIQALYAAVISEPAVAVLRSHGIAVSYDSLVPNIINRRGDGICPFEEAVMDVHDAASAYTAILKKMDAMQIKLWT